MIGHSAQLHPLWLSDLMDKEAYSYETSVSADNNAWCHNAKDCSHNNYLNKDMKTHTNKYTSE
jgi:hypothetical protein